jgi:hypothetical protein
VQIEHRIIAFRLKFAAKVEESDESLGLMEEMHLRPTGQHRRERCVLAADDKVDLSVRKSIPKRAKEWRRQQDVAKRTQPDEQELFQEF